MNKIFLLFIFSFLAACTTHFDYSTTFEVSGVVTSKDDNGKVEGAKIIFVDTGYDSKLSKKDVKHEVGITDDQGRIHDRFNYWWGYEEGILKSTPKETFDIVVEKTGYRPLTLHFNGKNMNQKNSAIQVEMGNVALIR